MLSGGGGWQNGFITISIFESPIFFAMLLPDIFLLSFVGNCTEKSSSTTKSLTHFWRGAGPKLVLRIPFCTGGGVAAGSGSKQIARPGGDDHEANASSGTQSEAPTRRWASEQHLEPEHEDSQHKLDQLRGSFVAEF